MRSETAITHTYDAYGNLTNDGTSTYTYDAANRLTSVTAGTNTTSYAYNGDGARVSQTVNGTLTTYLLDTATPLTMVLSETSNGQTSHYWQGLDTLAQSDGTNAKYFEYDGLGSVRQLTDSAGAVQMAQTFDPYGNLYASSGTNPTKFAFTGEHQDTNGLLFLRARYYAASSGRFLNTDPSRQEKNPYLYSGDNPINRVDPTGLRQWNPPHSSYEAGVQWGYEKTDPVFIQIEYRIPLPDFKGVGLYPDIIRSDTGDVFEVEPFFEAGSIVNGADEAQYYVDTLNCTGGGGVTMQKVSCPGMNLLEVSAPNNWNTVKWHLGSISSFPGYRWSGTIYGPNPGDAFIIPPGLDFVASSPAPGVIVWWYEIQPGVYAAAAAPAIIARLLNSKYGRHIWRQGMNRPANAPPVPVPQTAILAGQFPGYQWSSATNISISPQTTGQVAGLAGLAGFLGLCYYIAQYGWPALFLLAP